MDETGYELSASYMNGLVKSVRDAGLLDAVLPTLQTDLRAAFLRPAMQPWWDAGFAETLVFAVSASFGERAVEQVGYGVVADAIGPAAKPQVEALLAAGGSAPPTLFSQIEQFVAMAVRPVPARWTLRAPNQGTLELAYPRPVKKEIAVLWRGAIRYVFELTRATGKIDREAQGPNPGHLVFDVSWS